MAHEGMLPGAILRLMQAPSSAEAELRDDIRAARARARLVGLRFLLTIGLDPLTLRPLGDEPLADERARLGRTFLEGQEDGAQPA